MRFDVQDTVQASGISPDPLGDEQQRYNSLSTDARLRRTHFLCHPDCLPHLHVIGYAEELSVVCVGDIMLTGSVTPFIDKHGVDYPFDKTRDIIQAADIAIGNLEMSLATVGEPVPDKIYAFRGSPILAKGIANAGFDVLTLANNHIGDYRMKRCWRRWRF